MDCRLIHDARLAAQIELENTGNHDDCLGPISVLEHREAERFRAIDEQATAKVLLVLNNPVTAAVHTDKEEVSSRARYRRGRFQLAHDTSPAMWVWSAAGCRPAAPSRLVVEVLDHPDRDFQCDNPGRDVREQYDRQSALAARLIIATCDAAATASVAQASRLSEE
jgi:hypothetical protein